MKSQHIWITASCWLIGISFFGLTGWFEKFPPPAILGMLVGSTSLLLVAAIFFRTIADFFYKSRLTSLLLLHSIRAPIGAAFIVMSQQGLLPSTFAYRAGIGDIIVGVLGVAIVVVAGKLSQRQLYAATGAWNIIGLADLGLAVGTGIYLAFNQTDSMVWMTRLPLMCVPTLVLPVLFSTHFVMLYRIVRNQKFERPAAAVNGAV